jgi:hypothetical protein
MRAFACVHCICLFVLALALAFRVSGFTPAACMSRSALTRVLMPSDPRVCKRTRHSRYLVGRAVRGKPREFILPSARDAVFSMETLARYFDLLAGGHQDDDDDNDALGKGSGSVGGAVADDENDGRREGLIRDAIVVAIVDSDSTCAMYRLFHGLRPPPASAIGGDGDEPP